MIRLRLSVRRAALLALAVGATGCTTLPLPGDGRTVGAGNFQSYANVGANVPARGPLVRDGQTGDAVPPVPVSAVAGARFGVSDRTDLGFGLATYGPLVEVRHQLLRSEAPGDWDVAYDLAAGAFYLPINAFGGNPSVGHASVALEFGLGFGGARLVLVPRVAAARMHSDNTHVLTTWTTLAAAMATCVPIPISSRVTIAPWVEASATSEHVASTDWWPSRAGNTAPLGIGGGVAVVLGMRPGE